jgi:hypothetical protein
MAVVELIPRLRGQVLGAEGTGGAHEGLGQL